MGHANVESDGVHTWHYFVEGGSLLDVSSRAIKFQYCDDGNATCRGHIPRHRARAARSEPWAALASRRVCWPWVRGRDVGMRRQGASPLT